MEIINGTLSREQLKTAIREEIERIQWTFASKNEGYGEVVDGLYNFRAGALLATGEATPQTMYDELSAYRRKHYVTLAKNGIDDPNFCERERDCVVYGLIALAMHKLVEDEKQHD